MTRDILKVFKYFTRRSPAVAWKYFETQSLIRNISKSREWDIAKSLLFRKKKGKSNAFFFFHDSGSILKHKNSELCFDFCNIPW